MKSSKEKLYLIVNDSILYIIYIYIDTYIYLQKERFKNSIDF